MSQLSDTINEKLGFNMLNNDSRGIVFLERHNHKYLNGKLTIAYVDSEGEFGQVTTQISNKEDAESMIDALDTIRDFCNGKIQ